MAEIKRVIPKGRREKVAGKYTNYSGVVYEMKLGDESSTFAPVMIWADNPTPADFNEAPVGSWLYDLSATGAIYYKSGATTWKTVTTT